MSRLLCQYIGDVSDNEITDVQTNTILNNRCRIKTNIFCRYSSLKILAVA